MIRVLGNQFWLFYGPEQAVSSSLVRSTLACLSRLPLLHGPRRIAPPAPAARPCPLRTTQVLDWKNQVQATAGVRRLTASLDLGPEQPPRGSTHRRRWRAAGRGSLWRGHPARGACLSPTRPGRHRPSAPRRHTGTRGWGLAGRSSGRTTPLLDGSDRGGWSPGGYESPPDESGVRGVSPGEVRGAESACRDWSTAVLR